MGLHLTAAGSTRVESAPPNSFGAPGGTLMKIAFSLIHPQYNQEILRIL